MCIAIFKSVHYYIDGYNLLFRIKHTDDDNLAMQRSKVIEDLGTKIQYLEIDATLVFDAYCQVGDLHRHYFKNMEIVFTAEGETADEYILQALKNSATSRQHVVVTSDKNLAKMSKHLAAKAETVNVFLEWLNKRFYNKVRRSTLAIPKKNMPLSLTKRQDIGQNVEPTTFSEGCFDYYLQLFEERSREFIQEKQLQRKEKIKKKQSQRKSNESKVKKLSSVNDYERWLKAFDKE